MSKMISKRATQENNGPKDIFFVKNRPFSHKKDAMNVIRDIVKRELEILSENMELDKKLTEINSDFGKIRHILKGKIQLPIHNRRMEVEVESHRLTTEVENRSQGNTERGYARNQPKSTDKGVTSVAEVVRITRTENSLNQERRFIEKSRNQDKSGNPGSQREYYGQSLPMVLKVNTLKGINIIITDDIQHKLPFLPKHPIHSNKSYQ